MRRLPQNTKKTPDMPSFVHLPAWTIPRSRPCWWLTTERLPGDAIPQHPLTTPSSWNPSRAWRSLLLASISRPPLLGAFFTTSITSGNMERLPTTGSPRRKNDGSDGRACTDDARPSVGGGYCHHRFLFRLGSGHGLVSAWPVPHRRRFFYGRSRDDRMDCRLELPLRESRLP